MSELKLQEKSLILKRRINKLETLFKDLSPSVRKSSIIKMKEIDDLWEEIKENINEKIKLTN